MKAGQKVWYIDHVYDELQTGTLVSTEDQSGRDEHPTLHVKTDKFGLGMKERILSDWVFGTEAKGKAGFRRYIRRKMNRLRGDITRLKGKL